ncbi:MAG TPA: metallophosphoesterase family protein [Lunatimonas sp.]|nr:metallophosphoesterase family protein [Lunatimonas sp.]
MEDKNAKLFIIGDVHGCWHTYQELLNHWDPESELLIQLGDLVDRGNFSPQCLDLSQDLQREFPDRTVFLRGNHEHMMLRYLKGNDTTGHWLNNGGTSTLAGFNDFSLEPSDFIGWLESRALVWENNSVFVSHAGITNVENPYDVDDRMGVLWNRGPWKNIGKLQVIGHTPQVNGKATFQSNPPVLNIDTGAFRGICLTGVKLDDHGILLEEINIPTNNLDVN